MGRRVCASLGLAKGRTIAIGLLRHEPYQTNKDSDLKGVKPLYLCSKERYGVRAGSIVGCIRDGSILVAVFQVQEF